MAKVTLGRRPFRINAVISEHYAVYDSFSQDDSWVCNCDRKHYYKTRQQVNSHITEEIMAALHGVEPQ